MHPEILRELTAQRGREMRARARQAQLARIAIRVGRRRRHQPEETDGFALAAIPDEVVDALVVHGTPEECRAHVQRYVDNGVTIPVLALLPGGDDLAKAVESLAPGLA